VEPLLAAGIEAASKGGAKKNLEECVEIGSRAMGIDTGRLLMGAAPWLVMRLLEQYHLRWIPGYLVFLLVYAVVVAIHQHWVVSFLRPRIWEQIPGLCPGCGYDIRATPERCPECGKELFPSSR
jgi:hypothetical protein